jgi:hypothetical protein
MTLHTTYPKNRGNCRPKTSTSLLLLTYEYSVTSSGVPRIFSGWGGLTNSVDDRGQREWGSGGGSPLVRGSTKFANECNTDSDQVVTDLFSTEL